MQYLELIALLGVSGAHPGGLARTRRLVQGWGLAKDTVILDAGCGAGETAAWLAEQGYRVTGVDRSGAMLRHAQERADRLGQADVRFVKGDVERMPFADSSFDAVLVESVTAFTQAPAAMAEYYRVLKPGGRLLECEMSLTVPLEPELTREFCAFMELPRLYTAADWQQALRTAGFQLVASSFEPAWEQAGASAERREQQAVDPLKLADPRVMDAMMKYFYLVVGHAEHFSAGAFFAEKPVV